MEVASRLGGIHAQLMTSAELALWSRLDGLGPGAVARALWEQGSLVKTWTLRGTLHLVPREELALYAGAQGELRPRHHQPAWLRHHGLAREEAEAMVEAIPEALAGGPLTRAELADAVAARLGSAHLADRLRGGFGDLLKPVAFQGRLVFAPGDGPEVRFARPDPPVEPLPGPDAVREIARRWLAAYGPGTREQLARWFGTPSAAQAGRWIAALGDEAVPVELGGSPAWALAADLDAMAGARPAGVVRLLPAFDPFVVGGPRDAEASLPPAHKGAVFRPQGWISPVLLVDGRIAGTWRHERRGRALELQIAPFADPGSEVRAAAEAEAAAVAGALGGELALAWEEA